MVVTITKEDLIKKTDTAKSDLDKALTVLDSLNKLTLNPFVQTTINNILGRFGLPVQQINVNPYTPSTVEGKSVPKENPVILEKQVVVEKQNPLNTETVYEMILTAIKTILSIHGDIPLSELEKLMIDKKTEVIEVLKNAIKPEK